MTLDRSIKAVNASLMDEESKRIFAQRILFSITSDYGYIQELCQGKLFSRKKRYVLWGRGYWGEKILACYPNVNWVGVCDNNFDNKREFQGINLINIEDLTLGFSDCIVVIATKKYWKEILKQLNNIGIGDEKIINLGGIQEQLSKKIYFDLDCLPGDKDEVFIDGGCFDVSTSKSFIKWSKNIYKKIYAFEPDSINAEICEKIIREENIKKIEIFDCALSSENKNINFNQNGNETSGKYETGNTVVKGRRLEDIVKERVTFVKLDVEGMEYEALKGMEKIIRDDGPKLAISVYHKKEDIINIAQYLLYLRPSYKFYLRHYSIGDIDTVLYAIDMSVIE